ncbi:hypothetical protein L1987_21854 [Smallanthus sonchifolius]|uniref:Uncharacterized protein n=1 Tax=Smallanthus sonchifolius TaxID=185202 RepID=A0ACB9IEQ8_9ASTR|nr:hypothetical protein L1987_21854 [Smallanthus sonchifolius]
MCRCVAFFRDRDDDTMEDLGVDRNGSVHCFGDRIVLRTGVPEMVVVYSLVFSWNGSDSVGYNVRGVPDQHKRCGRKSRDSSKLVWCMGDLVHFQFSLELELIW